MKVGGEITEFNSRIAHAKELFKVSSQAVVVRSKLPHPYSNLGPLNHQLIRWNWRHIWCD